MKINFKKILSVAGSVLMVGSTVGIAMATGGGFPTPFVENNSPDYALVVGASAAATDMTGANSINTYLNTFYSIESEVSDPLIGGDFSDSVGIREDGIVLGSTVHSKMNKVLTDNKIATLLDSEFSWDDGDGSDTYDFHEEIILGDMVIQTTLDDSELIDDVVLENDKALSYRYVFDDDLNISLVGHEDADPLYLTILGKEYEVLKMGSESITVSFSDEKVVKTGDKVVSDGVTLTIGDIFLGSVEVNDILIKEGRTRVVNGIEVYIDTIAYHSSSDLPSKAIIKVGKDISQTISSGDEYTVDNEVGYEDDETWVWDIDLEPEEGEKPYIGVTYDIKSVSYDEDEPEENAISVGGQYVFPENYGAVVFEGLTDVNYEDFELSFADKDLYEKDDRIHDDWNVAILEGENDDSITLKIGTTTYETDSLYFRYVKAEGNESETVELYFKDIDGDFGNEGRIQLVETYGDVQLVVGDTKMDVEVDVNGLTLTVGEEIISIPLKVSDEDEFTELGGAEDKNRVSVNETDIGTKDDDILTHYGTYIRAPEDNADDDKVVLSIPDSQVFARVSVLGQGMAVDVSDVEDVLEGNETVVDDEPVVPELGGIVITDAEVGAHSDKNLIIVGGSCINSEAARLLGGQSCGSDFTLKTGVTSGKYIIRSFDDGGRIAIVVAGFNAADTTRGVADFIASTEDFSIVGTKIVG